MGVFLHNMTDKNSKEYYELITEKIFWSIVIQQSAYKLDRHDENNN